MRRHLVFAFAAAAALSLGSATAHAESAPHLSLQLPQLGHSHTAPDLMHAHLAFDELHLLPGEVGGGAGADVDPGSKRVLAFILGFLPGFGIGHAIAGDKQGFVLFLIVDIVVTAVAIVLTALAPEPVGALLWVAWVGEHVFEGYEAYVAAGGSKMVERSARQLMYAGDEGFAPGAPQLFPASRAVSFSF